MQENDEKTDLTLEELMAGAYKLDKKMLQDLEQCFKDDFTVEEACRTCNITTPTYYEWVNKSSEFRMAMERAKDYVAIEAKKILAQAVKNDKTAEVALKYLERRQKKLYSLRTELTGDEGKPISSTVTFVDGS